MLMCSSGGSVDVVVPRVHFISKWMYWVDVMLLVTTRKERRELVVLVTCWVPLDMHDVVLISVMRKFEIVDFIKTTPFLSLKSRITKFNVFALIASLEVYKF